ncbi:hypothetical protein SYNPS1DRAFT_17535 [Syncephalis pseudoplumigaleata]|uniref:Uncharacterized protein n=1 Tax=Syncephalis pseudoplumigaleata TaxID=1712513 RepID=A0A4P9YWF8_9FUNG|nr:hypothetical protein SYNPS1DRAFT_17535 [Syncephalis pseudoplumigaleata]|eukprot:RKP24185.1 hypothetical protein SYNPS1DRAFT_17535 [Syncephalis pseudoplumigaleata]
MHAPVADAANPVSFCKCACGQNVTIIELQPKLSKPGTEDCVQCTKSFCLQAQPDLCSGAGANDDLTAFCFQRDSYKDEFIVYLFLVTTIGLLLFAWTRPFLEQFLRVGWAEQHHVAAVDAYVGCLHTQ